MISLQNNSTHISTNSYVDILCRNTTMTLTTFHLLPLILLHHIPPLLLQFLSSMQCLHSPHLEFSIVGCCISSRWLTQKHRVTRKSDVQLKHVKPCSKHVQPQQQSPTHNFWLQDHRLTCEDLTPPYQLVACDLDSFVLTPRGSVHQDPIGYPHPWHFPHHQASMVWVYWLHYQLSSPLCLTAP